MEASLPPDDPATIFFVGHHDTEREEPVSLDVLADAQNLGYDFITTPLTTASFHHRVYSQLESHLSDDNHTDPLLMPLISPLSPKDTLLAPNASNSALMGIVSPWIDLASSDPVIARASRQVLSMEVAFAAFCGISNVIVQGPPTPDGVTQYSRAIAEALGLGAYVQLHILLPITGEVETDGSEMSNLSELSWPEPVNPADEDGDEEDAYTAWDIWHTIRSVCNYSQKLSLGKLMLPLVQISPSLRFLLHVPERSKPAL